ncbi:MAG: hypothetical protein DRN09_00185 [Thermoplasmata archaeon]|nr:MAG: hypothetical protein DRN09_00185 [Thermoplasmata archaeon]
MLPNDLVNLVKNDVIRSCAEDTKRGMYPSVLVCYKGNIDGLYTASEVMHHLGKKKEEDTLYKLAERLKEELL